MREERLGGLTVRITGGTDGRGGGVGPVVVLLHGFGAPGDDMVWLGRALDAPAGTRFVFPEGPLFLDLGIVESHAWWMIDLEKVAREVAAGRLRELSREVPPGLSEARERVVALLRDLDRRAGVKPSQTMLGGFSQGAMLACDVALRQEQPFAGLALLSGTLLARDQWEPLARRRRGLRIFQSHGRQDPLLPFALAEQLRDLLARAGLSVEWIGFRGGHEIPEPVIGRLGTFLKKILGPPAR
jgi:phospholipase/carboxylesterase